MRILILLLLHLLLLPNCAYRDTPTESLHTVSRVFYLMGTNLEFNLICNDRKQCLDAINRSVSEAKRIDKIFSNYRNDSELSNLSIKSGARIKVSKEFFELTAFSVFMSALTNGAFDISVGPLVKLWKNESKNNRIQDKLSVENIRTNCIGTDKLSLYSRESEIGFKSHCIRLDYGGIGKGYVLQRIVKLLEQTNIKNGLINFGGNIHALGTDLQGKPWVVNIKDPRDNNKFIKTINVINKSVSTSGGYERYFLVDGKKYSHIIDPRTGLPVSHLSSVTVVSESPLFADALSTAFSVLNIEESKKIIDKLDKLGFHRVPY
ncbi:MAG: hypothetical protein GTO02_16830 [Candidatus Dadabacteria bacterium]|nr:hypothetical protein [Candidatus Dadabacteria bacterium]NIQ15992.1 hypothetical protein [Candidatus Dadabacteria bacterium]